MDLGVEVYRNITDGFIFKAKEGSLEAKALGSHPSYEKIELEDKPMDEADGQLEEIEEKDQEDPIEDEPVDFQAYTVDQLKDLAKELGIAGYSNMKKDELIAAITKGD